MTKRTGLLTSSHCSFAASASALLAGAGLLVAAFFSFQDTQTQKAVTVNPGAWSYLSSIRLGVDHADASEEKLLGLDDESFPSAAAPLKFEKPLVSRAQRRAVKTRAVARNYRVQPVTPVSTQSTQDQIPATQAHAKVAEPLSMSTQAQGGATPTPLEAFQQMHRQLRQRFFAALRGDVPTHLALTTQPVAAVATGTFVAASEILSDAPGYGYFTRVGTRPAPKKVSRISAVSEGAASVVAKTALSAVSTTQLAENGDAVSGERVVIRSASASAKPFADYAAFQQQTQETYRQLSLLTQQTFGLSGVSTQSLTAAAGGSVALSGSLLTSSNMTSGLIANRAGGYSPTAEYSTSDLYKIWKSWNSRNSVPVVAQAPAKTVAVNLPAPVQVIAHANALEPKVEPTAAPTPEPTVPVEPAAPCVVEGFEWTTCIPGATSQPVTLEGWNQIQAVDHWPVIYWNPDTQAQAAMISHNTAVALSKFAETELQPDAAIVFGKIPVGWDVEYSDRAEKVVYLNAHNQPDAKSDEVRYFAFLNAAPGAQLVTLKGAFGAQTAAVAVPVLSGTSTYLDLTTVGHRVLSGYVLDAGAQKRTGIANASVGIVGQPNAVFFSTESGYFHLSDVFAIGTYPVFVETTMTTGFKHRYRVLPEKMDGVDLYRLGEEQIRGWVSQLEGGVSPDSGVIVAAMPNLVQAYGDGRLFPSTKTLLGNSTLTPETYTLSPDGELLEGKPLESEASRFISVQIPTGPVISQVEDNNQNVVWSQLVLAQPGVISIVGSY